MSGTINLHVGSIEDMGKRFIGAWHKLEQAASVEETHLTFLDLETMVSTLSPKRLALLRHVRQHRAESIAALAKSLRRDGTVAVPTAITTNSSVARYPASPHTAQGSRPACGLPIVSV